jgi:hypothetical protein
MMSYDSMRSAQGNGMSEQIETGPSEQPSRTGVTLFLALMACYYGLYSVLFSRRLAEYLQDLLRHFAFFRRLW